MANKKDNKKEQKLEKTEYGDIVKNTTLIKRTLMVSAFPALVKETEKDGKTYYEGFLPGFEFSEVEGSFDIGECMEQLQELLDENVEELVVFGQQLPNLPEDDELMEQNPGFVVRYLDINVYAEPEDMPYICGCEGECDDDCCTCGHDCDDEECDCHEHHCHCDCDDEDDECDCGCGCGPDCDCGCKDGKECTCDDENCHCGCHEHECDCDDEECDCDDDCDCGCKDGKECTCEHEHEHKHKGHECKCKNKK